MHSLLDSFILHFVFRRSNILSHVLPKVKWMSSYGLSRGWRLMSTRTTRTLSTDRETSSWLRWNCCRQWTIQRHQAEWLQGEIRRSLLLPIGFVSTSCINLSFYQLYQQWQFLSIVSISVSVNCINNGSLPSWLTRFPSQYIRVSDRDHRIQWPSSGVWEGEDSCHSLFHWLAFFPLGMDESVSKGRRSWEDEHPTVGWQEHEGV